MTDAERREEAQVVAATALILGDPASALHILGIGFDDASLSEPSTMRTVAHVVVHTAELRARLLECIAGIISTYCTLHASVEAVGASLSGTPIEARAPRNVDLAAVRDALADVVSPNGVALHSLLT